MISSFEPACLLFYLHFRKPVASLNCTEHGMKALAKLIAQALEQNNLSPPQLIRACAAIGHETSEKPVRRLLKGEYSLYPPSDLLFAITLLNIVLHADGTPWSLQDLLLVSFGLIDPFDNSEKPGTAYLRLAIAVIRDIQGQQSIEEFARSCNIAPKRMLAIVTGEVPNLWEILQISSQSIDRNGNHLANLYLKYLQEHNEAGTKSNSAPLKINQAILRHAEIHSEPHQS